MNWLSRWWAWLTGQMAQPRFPHLYWLMNCSWVCQATYVAARLDIAERLRDGPLSVSELARQCQVQETPLLQTLRALAGFGIFAQDSSGKFRLTRRARPLLHDAPHSVHAYALLWGEQLHGASSQMLEQVRTGKSAFQLHYGQAIWDYYRERPAEAETFDRFMNVATDNHHAFITAAADFSRFRRVVDVGAGRGSLLAAVLRANSHLKGIWYDRPEVKADAQVKMNELGLGDRCELIAGSFLDNVPPAADLYLIKHVLHDWSDEQAAVIVKNISNAMQADATLIIIEAVLDASSGVDGLCKMRDLEQMFWTGGRVRTREEFARLLHPANLKIDKIKRTPIVDVCLIEARK